MEQAAELEAQLVESLTAIGTIKRFGLESQVHEQTKSHFLSLLQSAYSAGLNVLISTVSVEFISQFLLIILLWVGTGYVLSREISPGELFSFYTLTGYFTGPATTLVGANKTIQEALIAGDRLFEVMDLTPADHSGSIVLKPNLLGDIRFEQVQFSHGSSVNVFENLNLHIPAGKFTAIIGESGSGKSTLIALLQNIYPIQKGNIFIGQYANQYISHDSLCRYVGIVPQHIDLFSGNVIENIAIGERPPDLQRVIDICSQLDILSFIESLPNGFHTYLGENGSTLSGGQKQRIAIARALYRKPEILILDEATSALDTTAEQCVYHAISNLLANRKTVIIITHRLSTIVKADKIIVLEKGKVVEEGQHEEMVHANGHYTHLWQKQHLTVSG
ncbi:Lactococcin-G-processing and transport ATP-binding protein LagD [compost metagenome]